MRPEPGQRQLDQRVASASVAERVAWNEQRRRLGQMIVWQQMENALLVDPLEQAEFLFRRLYPGMPEVWFIGVLARLRAKRDAGDWHGLRRPEAG